MTRTDFTGHACPEPVEAACPGPVEAVCAAAALANIIAASNADSVFIELFIICDKLKVSLAQFTAAPQAGKTSAPA
jgi:hypothetical protein